MFPIILKKLLPIKKIKETFKISPIKNALANITGFSINNTSNKRMRINSFPRIFSGLNSFFGVDFRAIWTLVNNWKINVSVFSQCVEASGGACPNWSSLSILKMVNLLNVKINSFIIN